MLEGLDSGMPIKMLDDSLEALLVSIRIDPTYGYIEECQKRIRKLLD